MEKNRAGTARRAAQIALTTVALVATNRSAIAETAQHVRVVAIDPTGPAERELAPSSTVRVSVPKGPLEPALTTLAEQAGLKLAYETTLTDRLTTSGVEGELMPLDGLTRLLAGTGLSYHTAGTSTVTLVNPRHVRLDSAATEQVQLEELHVEGRGQSPSSAGYVARSASVGSKADTPLIEIPQSVSVITRAQIDAVKPQSLIDVVGYTAGVTPQFGFDRTSDIVSIRGFETQAGYGNFLRDGMKYQVNLFDGQTELFGIERIEILKGAASVLYGTSAPGGIINMVSKRPTAAPLYELGLEGGSFNRKQVTVDLSDRIDEDGSLRYRFTGLLRDSDTYIDSVKDNRAYLAPALTWEPTAATSLTLFGVYQRTDSAYQYGLPSQGTILPNPYGRIPRGRYLGVPGFDKYDSTIASLSYEFSHTFTNDLVLRSAGRQYNADVAFNNTYGILDPSDLRTVYRFPTQREDRSIGRTADTSINYKYHGSFVEHDVILGYEAVSRSQKNIRYTAPVAPIDLFAPVYGAQPSGFVLDRFSTKSMLDLDSVYLQDQIKIADRFVLSLGGRYDWAKIGGSSYLSGLSAPTQAQTAFTGRAGLVFLGDYGLSPFASYSTSFEPLLGFDGTGNPYRPTTGDQYEAGLRYQPAWGNMLLSAAVYQLTKQNVLTFDPAGIGTQTGEVRSRGFELEAKGQLTDRVGVIAAYAYTDARTVKSTDPSEADLFTGAIPRHQFSLWSDYAFGGELTGLKAGAGLRFLSSTKAIGRQFQGLELPDTKPYALVDLGVTYVHDNWKLSLILSNLFDDWALANCAYGYCYYVEPRRVIAGITYRF